MTYYVKIKDDIAYMKSSINANVDLNGFEDLVVITEEEYNGIQIPSTVKIVRGKRVYTLIEKEKEEKVIEEYIDEEKVAMAEAIVNLTLEIEKLKNRINGGAV